MEMSAPSLQQIEVLTRHTGWVRALAGRLVADPDLADDVAQDAALAALASGERAQRGPAWLAGVVRNIAANLRQRGVRRAHAEARAARAEAQPGAAETAALVEQQRLLAEAVLALDDPFRDVVLLRFYENLARREIARRLQVPVATVNSRLGRALHKLRARLDCSHGGDRGAWVTALAPFAWVPAAAAEGWVLGALIMQNKKAIAAALAVLLVGGGVWLGMRTAGDGGRAAPVSPRSVALGAAGPDEEAAPSEPAVATAAERVAVRDEPPGAAAHGVRVRVVDGPTGEPLPGAEVRRYHDALRTAPAAIDALRDFQLYGGDSFQVTFDVGLPVPLDEDAICIVEVPDSLSIVGARYGGSRARFRPRADWAATGELVTMPLWPVRTARVRVVDRTGKPLANVPVHLNAYLRGEPNTIGLGYTRAPDGIVVHSWFRGMLGDGACIRPGVSLAFPVAEEVMEPLDADEPKDVTLVCPEVGTVEVVVTLGGEPAPDGTLVLLQRAQPGQTAIAAETRNGRARFWPVGLGTTLVASTTVVDDTPPITATGDGPKRPGETVTLSLANGLYIVHVSGRILASDGRPIEGQRLTARVADDTKEVRATMIETDGEGRFERAFAVDEGRAGGFRLEVDGAWVAHGSAEVWARDPTHSGHADVGDVRMPAGAPLVEGVVVDERGEPLQGAAVWLMRRSVSTSTGWDFADDDYIIPTTDASGRFAMYGGVAPAPDLGLCATEHGPWRHDPEAFGPGARGVRLVMHAAGVVAGRLLVAPSVPMDRLYVEVRPASRGTPSLTADGGNWRPLGRDGGLMLWGLAPDSYTVAVMLPGKREVARVEGVVVRAGTATSDPRLLPLDLTGAVRVIDVLVRNEKGETLRASVRAFTSSDPPGKRTVQNLGHSDYPLLLAAADDVHALVVECDGYFSAVLDPVEDRHEVVLRRGLPVTVRVANAPVLEEPYSLRVALDPVVPAATSSSDRQVADDRDLAQPNQATLAPGGGQVELRVREAGVYRARVIVQRDEAGSRSERNVVLDPAPEVRVAEGESAVLPIEVDPAAVQRAIAELPR